MYQGDDFMEGGGADAENRRAGLLAGSGSSYTSPATGRAPRKFTTPALPRATYRPASWLAISSSMLLSAAVPARSGASAALGASSGDGSPPSGAWP